MLDTLRRNIPFTIAIAVCSVLIAMALFLIGAAIYQLTYPESDYRKEEPAKYAAADLESAVASQSTEEYSHTVQHSIKDADSVSAPPVLPPCAECVRLQEKLQEYEDVLNHPGDDHPILDWNVFKQMQMRRVLDKLEYDLYLEFEGDLKIPEGTPKEAISKMLMQQLAKGDLKEIELERRVRALFTAEELEEMIPLLQAEQRRRLIKCDHSASCECEPHWRKKDPLGFQLFRILAAPYRASALAKRKGSSFGR